MNEKLKQSLEGRLGGMRWGEREQQEVFRQIQRKELQDVKHVKRGTGLLAIAIAMLFIVAGAAFALTSTPQPEDAVVSGQPTQTEFIPVPAVKYENDYFTVTIDSSAYNGDTLDFTATIRLKDPQSHMLMLAGHTPPGDPGRTPVTLSLKAAATATAPDETRFYTNDLTGGPEVLSMTSDAAVFRMVGEVTRTGPEMYGMLQVSYTIGETEAERLAEITWPLTLSSAPATVLLENEYITATLVERRIEGTQATIIIDITPSKSWYALNTQAEDKATLTVSADPLELYECDTAESLMSLVEHRLPAAGELSDSLATTSTGLRYTAQGTLPTGVSSLTGYTTLTIYSEAAVMHNATQDVHYAELIVPLVLPQDEAAAATPTPQPAVTVRSEPQGEHIGGDEIVSVYLEDSWSDGFTTVATLRIRADDAANHLAAQPNLNGIPDSSTWVITLENNDNSSSTSCTIEMHTEEATGDLLADITFLDLNDHYQEGLLDLTLTTTNELTWEKHSSTLCPVIQPEKLPNIRTLHLVSSTADDMFVQGAMLTSSRYQYIGVMLNYDATRLVRGSLQGLADSDVVVSGTLNTNGRSLELFPQMLFPYDGDDDAHFSMFVLRVDRSVILPDPLPIHLTGRTQTTDDMVLGDLMLSTTPPQVSSTPQEVSIRLDGNVLFDNEYVTVSFADADYGAGHAFAHIDVALKDADRFTTSEDIPQGRTYLDVQLTFTGYTGALYQDGRDFTSVTDSFDSGNRNFYLHACSDQWTEEQPPVIFARLTLASADGSVQAEYLAQFAFPVTGEVQLYSIIPAESAVCENFEFVSSQLACTDYLSLLTVQYRCSEPDDAPVLRFAEQGMAPQAALYADDFADRRDPLLRQVTCHYAHLPAPAEAADIYTLNVYDGHHHLADFPVTLTRIGK